MCCMAGFFGGNLGRLIILIWYLVSSDRWHHTFSVFWWPLLGALFAPWTTLAYVLVYTGGVHGWEWALIVVGAVIDASAIGSSGRGRRGRGRARPRGAN